MIYLCVEGFGIIFIFCIVNSIPFLLGFCALFKVLEYTLVHAMNCSHFVYIAFTFFYFDLGVFLIWQRF
ncbi:hypothetical protein V1505DRAFT_368937 [Lipomyces doorenjongii]